MRRLLVITGLFVCLSSALLAEARIQRYLSAIRGYRFVMESEIVSVDRLSAQSTLDRDLLADAGFSSFTRWRVLPERGPEIGMDVVEVQDSPGAYLLFSHWPNAGTDTISLDVPIRVRWNRSEAIFWRGEFYFRIFSPAGGNLSTAVFSSLIREFVQAISQENLLPVSISHLPEEELHSDSIRLYLGEKSLRRNDRFPEPLLEQIGLADRIEIAYAEYGEKRQPLFLIGYPTVALAKKYLVSLQKGLEGFFSEEGIYIKRTGVLIAIFVGPEADARRILDLVKYKPSIQWLHEKKPESRLDQTLTFLGLITRTIIGTGVFLLLILGTGLSFGLIRYEIIRRFPSIFQKEKMIRLQLDRKNRKDQD